jgi:hypothetical protein
MPRKNTATMLRKNTAANFWMLLVGGQRVDWQFSLIMMLVIGGLICTPLILGSIRDRAYQVHKREVEITNNAREIRISSSGERSKAQLDDEFVAGLAVAEPTAVVFGNFTVAIKPEGPRNVVEVPSASALARKDPRIDVFDIETINTAGLEFRDLIISDTLGRRLYGAEAWEAAWVGGRFAGPPLRLNYANQTLAGDFQIVGRQKRGRDGLFFSPRLGNELRSISDGLGSPELAVPPNAELVAISLPKLRTGACVLHLPEISVCPREARQNLSYDLRSRQHIVEQGSIIARFLGGTQPGMSQTINMMEARDSRDDSAYQPSSANCSDLIGPMVTDHCQQATLMQLATANVAVRAQDPANKVTRAQLLGVSPEMFALMQLGIEAPADPPIVPRSLEATGVIQVVAPASTGLTRDEPFAVIAGAATLRGRVAATYPCKGDCRIFADVESTFRLQNIADGLVEVVSGDPLSLRPKRTQIQYDEVLVYPGTVEEVVDLSNRLKALLGDDYRVSPNMIAINNLKRDNARLSAIFLVTVVFALVFLLLSLGALSKINVDRRRRQMAQLLILGVSRWFVRLLVLCEYFLITILSTLFALMVSALLCAGLRMLILGGYLGEMPTDAGFQRVVNAMEIDPGMFAQLCGIVIICSLAIASMVAMSASRANPIELLD